MRRDVSCCRLNAHCVLSVDVTGKFVESKIYIHSYVLKGKRDGECAAPPRGASSCCVCSAWTKLRICCTSFAAPTGTDDLKYQNEITSRLISRQHETNSLLIGRHAGTWEELVERKYLAKIAEIRHQDDRCKPPNRSIQKSTADNNPLLRFCRKD